MNQQPHPFNDGPAYYLPTPAATEDGCCGLARATETQRHPAPYGALVTNGLFEPSESTGTITIGRMRGSDFHSRKDCSVTAQAVDLAAPRCRGPRWVPMSGEREKRKAPRADATSLVDTLPKG